jgi:3-phosphoshikimate 1-carboxyvinyltransferase
VPSTILDAVAAGSAERPGDLAIVEVGEGPARTWTWQELDEQSDACADGLLRMGVRAGEPVACQLPNWGEFVVIALGILKANTVCCPLMPIFARREVSLMLGLSRARILFLPGLFRGRHHPAEVSRFAGSLPDLRHVIVVDPDGREGMRGLPHGWQGFTDFIREPADRARPPADADPVAQMMFTSGTSGVPKAVTHRSGSLDQAADLEILRLGLGPDDRVFVPSPLAHQTGFLYGMWLALRLGVPQILQPVWDAQVALGALRQWRGTFVQAATPFLADLVKMVEGGQPAPRDLRTFVASGAAVPRELAERAVRVLDAAVCGAWGSTETCLGTLSGPGDDPARMWGTDGRPLKGVRIRTTGDLSRALPPDVEGNLEVWSPTMFDGYAGRGDLTAEAFTPDGWFRTGDLGVIDAEGYLRVTGRVKDLINRGGEKIPVGEVEQELLLHPAVDEVALVAMPDGRLGERACAFVVPPEGGPTPTLTQLHHFLRHRGVTRHYWPEKLRLIGAMPRTGSGKIQRFVLREMTTAPDPSTGTGGGTPTAPARVNRDDLTDVRREY